MIGAMLDDRLVGAWLENKGHLDQSSTVSTGAELNGSWNKASIGKIGVLLDDPLLGARLDQPMKKKMGQSLTVLDEAMLNWVIWGKVKRLLLLC